MNGHTLEVIAAIMRIRISIVSYVAVLNPQTEIIPVSFEFKYIFSSSA